MFAIAYSPDGTKFVTGGGDNQVVVWDAQTTSKKVRMSYHLDDIHAVGFTADGARVISAGDDRTIRMFDTKTGEALGILFAPVLRILGSQ